MDGYLTLNQIKVMQAKDMLHQNKVKKKCAILLVILLTVISCVDKNKEKEIFEREIREKAISEIGIEEFGQIMEMAKDSVKNWQRNRLKAWVVDTTTIEFQFDSLLCVNVKKDKIVMAHMGRQLQPDAKLDAIAFFYGVKIKEQWYFFSGPTMYIPRDPENLKTPTSFTKLHEIAIDNIFKGYLKKNKESGEWEINEGFFADLTGIAGCADCKTQVQWDSVYLATVRENWKNRDTTNYKPLQ